jgi:hypothetical protein
MFNKTAFYNPVINMPLSFRGSSTGRWPRSRAVVWVLALLLLHHEQVLCFIARPSAISMRSVSSTSSSFFCLYYIEKNDEQLVHQDEDCDSEKDARSPLQWNDDQYRHPLRYMSSVPTLWQTAFESDSSHWTQEWHDSFLRNGLADFVPPVNSNVKCLLLGPNFVSQKDEFMSQARLPWEDKGDLGTRNSTGEESVTSTDSSVHEGSPSSTSTASAGKEAPTNKGISLLSSPPSPTVSLDYDCILDRGLMNGILLSLERRQLPLDLDGKERHDAEVNILKAHRKEKVNLLYTFLTEASHAMREHGIYVMMTQSHLLDSETKSFLRTAGASMGMQWEFELDGISTMSSDQTQSETPGICVSVGRKFFHEELASMGHNENVVLLKTAAGESTHTIRPKLAP